MLKSKKNLILFRELFKAGVFMACNKIFSKKVADYIFLKL